MKKRLLIISLILITVLLGIGLSIFVDFENKSKYNINLGETFKIKLHANNSTGYSNCWINEYKSDKVKLINERYKSSLREKFGYVGAGGTVIWTFKGIKPGMDTIKIANCPPGPLLKDCKDFSVDSIKPDYQFLVEINNK